MQNRQIFAEFLVWLVSPLLFLGCTLNPFGTGKISGSKKQISGTVILKGGASPKGVFVWLEDFDVSAFTDESGEFQILLPAQPRQSMVQGTISEHTLYFYLANYKLATAKVAVMNGEFFYDRDDITKDGRVRGPVIMQPFLRIMTAADPIVIGTNSDDTIRVLVTLQATGNCVPVLNPKIIIKNKFIPVDTLGAILLRNLDSGEIFIFQSTPQAQGNEQLVVCQEPTRRMLTFTLDQVPLPPAKYEIIPYLLFNPEDVPQALLENLGTTVNALNANYLKKPMRREGGQFEVKP